MAIPKAVQRQAEEAEKLAQQIKEEEEKQRALDTPPEPAPAEQPQPGSQQNDDWEHRYKVLDGKYKAEVPRLNQQIQEEQSKRSELEQRAQAMEAELKAAREEAAANQAPPEYLEKLRGEYNEDLVSAFEAQRTENTELKKTITELSAKVKLMEGNVSTVQKDSEELQYDRYIASIDRAVPNWREINNSKEFHGWLAQKDPIAGEVRQKMLDRMDTAWDSAAVIRMFNAYLAQAGQGNKGPSMENMEQPATKGNGTPTADQKVWTVQEIKEFYNAAARKLVSPEDFKRINNEIETAQREGRVR